MQFHQLFGTSADREASKPAISELSVTKLMDAASPAIFTEACVGKGKIVKIDLCTVGSDQIDTYMSYELEDCMISGYSVSTGGDRPQESLSFSFTKMTMKFIPYDKNGKPTIAHYLQVMIWLLALKFSAKKEALGRYLPGFLKIHTRIGKCKLNN